MPNFSILKFEGFNFLLFSNLLKVPEVEKLTLNISAKKPSLNQVSDSTIERIREINALDIQLYQFAQELFLLRAYESSGELAIG